MKKLKEKIQALSNCLDALDKIDPAVSAASIGWHIEHSLLVIKQITSTVAQSDPSLYQPKFNFSRSWVFLLNYIPRGKAKAPKSVMPTIRLSKQALEESIVHTYQALTYLNECEANQYFMHPYFGALNQEQTIRFLNIHTKHHLKIIQDILKR